MASYNSGLLFQQFDKISARSVPSWHFTVQYNNCLVLAGCERRAKGAPLQAELQRVPHQQLQQIQRQLWPKGKDNKS